MAGQSLTVLQVLPALESGGVERGTLEIGAGLVHAGHRSLVISAGGRLVSRLTGQGSEHFQWPIGRKSVWDLASGEALAEVRCREQGRYPACAFPAARLDCLSGLAGIAGTDPAALCNQRPWLVFREPLQQYHGAGRSSLSQYRKRHSAIFSNTTRTPKPVAYI